MSSTISLAVDPQICRSIAIGREGVDINGAFLKSLENGKYQLVLWKVDFGE